MIENVWCFFNWKELAHRYLLLPEIGYKQVSLSKRREFMSSFRVVLVDKSLKFVHLWCEKLWNINVWLFNCLSSLHTFFLLFILSSRYSIFFKFGFYFLLSLDLLLQPLSFVYKLVVLNRFPLLIKLRNNFLNNTLVLGVGARRCLSNRDNKRCTSNRVYTSSRRWLLNLEQIPVNFRHHISNVIEFLPYKKKFFLVCVVSSLKLGLEFIKHLIVSLYFFL